MKIVRKEMTMMTLKKLLLIVYLAFSFSQLNGQLLKHKFDRYTVKQGLAGASVYYMLQDRNGFMWFATSNGISKFDGYTFTNYRQSTDNANGLSGNTCIYLMEDNSGKIWVVNNSASGIDRFDPEYERFENFNHDTSRLTSLSSGMVNHILQDSEGKIWICTAKSLDLLVSGGDSASFRHFYNPKDVTNFSKVHINKDGVMILFSEVAYYFNRERFQFVPSYIDIGTDRLTSVSEDSNGNLYIGTTTNGLIRLAYDPAEKKYSRDTVDVFNPDPNRRSFILVDKEDRLWLGTATKGLFKYEPGKETYENFLNDELDLFSIPENAVHSLFIDKTGMLWTGSVSQGISKYDLYRKEFYHYKSLKDNPNSISGNLISSLHSISADELWVGMRGDGGVTRIIFDQDNKAGFIHYKNDPEDNNSLMNNNVLSLVQRKNGEVWVGSGSLTFTKILPEEPFSGKKAVFERFKVNGWTFTIFEDSEGIMWGGTWGGGLWRYNEEKGNITVYNNNPEDAGSLGDNVVWAIHEDDFGNIWIGGNSQGISILTKEQKYAGTPKFINIKNEKENPNSLSGNMINAFLQDSKGTMWIATNGGLNRLIAEPKTLKNLKNDRDLKFYSYTMENGLPDNTVQGIVEDKEHNLWLSTSNGLSFFNTHDTTFSNYFENDGLQSDEFWHNSYFINANGFVFFGGKNGITAFDPASIKANPFIPDIVFANFRLFNKTVKVGEKVNKDVVLKKNINHLSNVVLSHKNNVFTIEFSALHFAQPERNQYAYYLEGFEDDWNYVEGVRSATYTNLNPGRYIFHVKGSNNNGNWNDKGKSLNIRIKAAWYNTWLSRILYIIALALIVWYIIRERRERNRREKEKLRKKIEEGEKELQKRMDEIEKQKQEIEEQDKRDFNLRYLNAGMSRFAEIIADDRQDLEQMTRKLIFELVSYTKSNVGAIYITDDSDTEFTKLVKKASYSYDSDIRVKNDIIPGEGYVGTCYKEKKTIMMNDLPKGYIVLRSGLGSISATQCLLVPIINNDICLGVIEIASISPIEQYKTDLVTKLSENFASVIALSNANTKTLEMLARNKLQAEELLSQDEELRQTLEEMNATQEELKRRIETYEKEKGKRVTDQNSDKVT
ncbi:MAG: two-component regulator propeller domain-containing protein [Bacteroidales bacterium]